MKRIVSIALVLFLLLAMAVPAMAASGYVSLGASATSLKRGDSFTVTASLSGAEPIALGTVLLNFDSSVFTLTGGTCHVAGANPGLVVPGNKVGTFMLSGDPQYISGALFTFNFVVSADAAFGNYTISSSANVGVDNGEAIGSGTVNISVVCDHSYGDWSKADGENHSKTCSVCQDVQTEGHQWDAGKETKAPTCKEEGEKTYTCSVCKATKTEAIGKTENHTFGSLTPVDEKNHKDT